MTIFDAMGTVLSSIWWVIANFFTFITSPAVFFLVGLFLAVYSFYYTVFLWTSRTSFTVKGKVLRTIIAVVAIFLAVSFMVWASSSPDPLMWRVG